MHRKNPFYKIYIKYVKYKCNQRSTKRSSSFGAFFAPTIIYERSHAEVEYGVLSRIVKFIFFDFSVCSFHILFYIRDPFNYTYLPGPKNRKSTGSEARIYYNL